MGLVSPLIKKLEVFMQLSNLEITRLQALTTPATFAKNENIILQEDDFEFIYLLFDGWVSREKILSDGRRVIVNFVLPGDFLCLNALLFRYSLFTLKPLTHVSAVKIKPQQLMELFQTCPKLALGIAWVNACEESLIEERVASLARRTARERMAHFFLEIWRRLQLLGLTEEGTFRLPITQIDLADSLGMSQVHVNRVLKALRRDGMIDFLNGSPNGIGIVDFRGLEKMADFQDGYLHFTEVRSPIAS